MSSRISVVPTFIRGRWAVATAVASALVVAGIGIPHDAARATPPRPDDPVAAAKTHKVTLVTGDVVTLTTMADGKQVADVDRPDNAVGGVRMQEIGGDLYVIPDEAVGLLGADRLDRRLFDVTDLVEMGYDDAHRTTVPVIASYVPSRTRSAAIPPAPTGSTEVRELPSIHGAALTTPKRKAHRFWRSLVDEAVESPRKPELTQDVQKLWLDGRVQPTLSESVPQIGAPEAWAAGFDGKGVKVAVLDTGVDLTHPDLVGQIDGTKSFVPGEDMTDINGHGTHVVSTIVSTGAGSEGKYKGVAPGADLIMGKVLGGPEGSGQDSWVMAGMQWAAESGAKVVSMSLGDAMPSDGSDPMSLAVDSLSAQYGSLFVIAAGNAGPETISTPGAAASALTVGAVDKQDQLAYFSSTGPLTGTGAMKPDITAPGVDITAARSQQMTDGGSGLYRTLSGTSMATPHVAGAAAILAQQHPAWTGEQLKDQLMSSAKGLDATYSPFEVGTGRVDVAAAIHDTVRATPTAFFGNYTWPHEATDVAVTKDVVLTNDGDHDVTLDLAVTNAAFTLGASTVTIPAGAKETVPVTGDPQAVGPGRHTGYLVGTDAATGKPVTRTSLGLIKEDERYDLNIELVDRAGKPAAGYVGVTMAGDPWPYTLYVEGSTTMRVSPGVYSVTTYLDVAGEGSDRSGLAVLVDPETKVDKTTTVVLDARKARLLQTTAPQRTENRQRKVDFRLIDPTGLEVRSAYNIAPAYDDVYVSPTEPVQEGSFVLTTRWRKGEPGLTLESGHDRFDTLVQAGSSRDSWTRNLGTVYAGAGAAADYQGINARGRIAVVSRTDAVTPGDRAAAAAAAGAKALIVVNDGVGALMEYVGDSTIPVASVHRDQGRALIAAARHGRKLTVRKVEYPSYVYDLTRDYPGKVPDRPLVYAPQQRDLARIDERFYGVHDSAASGYRYDLTLSPSLGAHEREWHPGTRVDWVTPNQVWAESHAQNLDGALPWDMISGEDSYQARTTTRLDWFRPAVRPGMADSFAVQNSRWQNYMTFNVQPWSSSSDQMRLGGYLPWGETPTHLQVFQGDTLIHDNPYSADMQWVEVPAGDRPYRAVLDAERPADVFGLSTRTHTEWTFRSDTTDADNFVPFSVMELGYRLETDLRGTVDPKAVQRIDLRSVSMDGGPLPGKLRSMTLDISTDDGASWRPVVLTRGTDGWWHGTFKPADRGGKRGGHLSVRASASMDSGYRIKQEVIRAYGLR